MKLRLLRDRDADERRVERERDEGAHRLAEQGAVHVHRDDGDTAREAAHDLPEIVPVRHGPIIGAPLVRLAEGVAAQQREQMAVGQQVEAAVVALRR